MSVATTLTTGSGAQPHRTLGSTSPGSVRAASKAFLIYVSVSILIWGLPVIGHLGSRYEAMDRDIGDPDFYRWALAWTPWALVHGQNPLFTHMVFAPQGTDLTWTALVPGPALLAWPVTWLFGSLASYNLLMLLSPALAALGAYLVCRRVTGTFWPSFAGGYLFGFSTYMAGQMQRNLNLVLIFPVPIAVYLVIRQVEGSIKSRTFLALISITLLGLFSVSTELFATTALFGCVAFLLAWAVADGRRRTLTRTAALAAGAYLIVGALVLMPYVLPALRNAPAGPVRRLDRDSADLLGFVVPRDQTLIGGPQFAGISDRFTAALPEDGSYIGVAGLIVLIGFGVTERRRKETWALLGFVAIVTVLSLGPQLHVEGEPRVSLPGAVLSELPLIKNAVPERFPAYSALAIGTIAAIWLARARGRAVWIRWALVLLAAVMMLPSVRTPPWHAWDRTPAFFSDGTYASILRPGENVAVVATSRGEALLWQATAHFSFRVPHGYIGPGSSFNRGRPLHGCLYVVDACAPPSSLNLAAWVRERGVTAMVMSDAARTTFEPLLRSAGFEPIYQGEGVSVWRVGSSD